MANNFLLGQDHFLSLPRPDVAVGPPTGAPDTTTLAAHDFDVDTRTGFMPPQQPLLRLPDEWELWEDTLDRAIASKLQLGSKVGLTEEEREISERWRARVREVRCCRRRWLWKISLTTLKLPILPTTELKKSEVLLRRAHLVLGWLMHFYIHTLPPTSPIVIPAPITLPVLQVSRDLQLPPVITYSDDVLYNWRFTNGQQVDSYGNDILPTVSNISAQTLFTGTSDEAEFYLSSARMELKGVEALELMRSMMDEMFVGDDIATRRITEYLHELAEIIKELGVMLLKVKEGCKPDVFYHEIRPWFRGEDSSEGGGKWVFEGLELDETLCRPTELSGASAGQSSLVHALDVFLGVDQFSHSSATVSPAHPGSSQTAGGKQPRSTFLKRMQGYMPRHHRAFLNHLANTPRPLRDFVLAKSSQANGESDGDGQRVLEAYNAAVGALKVFRDKHMIIVTLYIIGPARRKDAGSVVTSTSTSTASTSSPSSSKEKGETQAKREPLKGTGGTDLVKFLKSVRDQTKDALLEPSPSS
ncbi:hypothetical protein MD484_g2861, partial [Candolleomyces efflorescens]